MSWPAATSPFLRYDDVTLEEPCVAVSFKFFHADGSSSCLVKHIHLEALQQFEYFNGLESFRSCQGTEGENPPAAPNQLELNMPQNVRMEDIFAFVLYLYEGHMPTSWREVYSIWCLCDFLLAPYEWRSKLMNRLWQSVKGKDIPLLRQLADGSPELNDFCDRAEKFVSCDRDELHQLLNMVFLQQWAKRTETQERIFQKVEKTLTQVDSYEVLCTLLEFLKQPACRYLRQRTRPPFGRRWQLRAELYHSRPTPLHKFKDKMAYDVLGFSLKHRRFHWLWRQLLPFIEHPEWVVQRWRKVGTFFSDLIDMQAWTRCTILKELDSEDGGPPKYVPVQSEVIVPLNQVLDVDFNPRFGDASDMAVPSTALEDMLLIGCKLLASDCISTQEFLTLLDIGAPPKPNMFSLDGQQLSRVLQQVPGMHSAMVRKHILACKELFKTKWGSEGLLSALLDMF